MITIPVILRKLTHNSGVLLRLIIFILFLSPSMQVFASLADTPEKVKKELGKFPLYKEGANALENSLPKVAVRKFRELHQLQDTQWSPEASAHLSLALAEALIRSASLGENTEKLASEALQILEQEELKKLPHTPLWQAEALAALNRFRDANDALSQLSNLHPLYHETLITKARLLIAMTRYNRALTALKIATRSEDERIRTTALLLTAEINLSLENLEVTNASLDDIVSTSPDLVKKKEYLKAQLSLKTESSTDTVSRFLALLDKPKHLTEELYHLCMLGLAEAYTKNQQPEVAISTLETFISENPHSSILPKAFDQLSNLIPADLPDDAPSIIKLRQWSATLKSDPVVIYPDTGDVETVPYYQPRASQTGNLEALALYHRARILAKSTKPKNHQLALSLLNQLRIKHFPQGQTPTAFYSELRAASLIDTAYLQLILKQPESAAFSLSVIESISPSLELRDQANIVQGLLLNKEDDYARSLAAFRAVRTSTSSKVSSVAELNAGIMALKASKLGIFKNILDASKEVEIKNTLRFERALWQCQQGEINGRVSLTKFVKNNTTHPRILEARLALAEAAINISPKDTSLAKVQVEIISPLLVGADNQYRITRIAMKIAEAAQKWGDEAALAQKFINDFPDDQRIPVLTLKRGASYFKNEDYNQARLIFKELANEKTEPSLRNYANFYSALSARLSGTEQAREESIELFQTVIDNQGELAAEARIHQSRILIDLRRYEEAQSSLNPLLENKETPLFRKIDAGILLADSLHRQGATDSKKYAQATVIYNDLLSEKNIPLGKKNRLNFLLGKTYENMGESEKAFQSYYSVMMQNQLTRGQKTIHEEWKWFYQCSFQALSMLESESRWEAAVKLARNIASSQGPRSEEAAQRADSIAKTHLIWEDSVPRSDQDQTPEKTQ